MEFLMAGDDLGSLPLVTNNGPGTVAVRVFDASDDLQISFKLFAGTGRQVPVPAGGSIEIVDQHDILFLGSNVTIN